LPPTARPIPRFVAEPPHELQPHGRWRDLLDERFLGACRSIDGPDELEAPGEALWFPERTYAGRVYVPAVADCEGGYELFGYVSFLRDDEQADPRDFTAVADYTSETAARNPDWKLDLNEEVLAAWSGPANATGSLTLVWGTPLVRGGVAVTAELGDDTVDQCALDQEGRFTLVALDAVKGLGDDLYLEVKLWSRRGDLLAGESLYTSEI
jgi:hypothetical protein